MHENEVVITHCFLVGWLMPKIEILITHGDADMVSMGLRHGKPMVTLPVIRE
jgi:UDP:flavonoid glycosyltransferase YjiC (YdhE family)